MLWTCGGIAVGCAILAVIVLRTRPETAEPVAPGTADAPAARQPAA
jgi:hypothetical protein